MQTKAKFKKNRPLSILYMVLCLLPFPSLGAEIAILPLKHRTPEMVLPALRPFLTQGAAIHGDKNQIIIRTNTENLKQLKTILEQIDRPLQQLLITVKQLSTREASRFRAEIKASQGNHHPRRVLRHAPKAPDRIAAHMEGTRTRDQGSNTQQVRVLAGEAAFIQTGHSLPFAESKGLISGTRLFIQQSIQYKNVVSGFEVVPRTNGNRVILKIRPYQANLSSQDGGRIGIQALATEISVPSGEWIELGSANNSQQQQGVGNIYSTHARREEARHVFIRVDKVE